MREAKARWHRLSYSARNRILDYMLAVSIAAALTGVLMVML